MKLSKVRLNRGGYDSRGRYYGTGKPLYKAEAEVCGKDREVHVRASSRTEAKREAESELKRYAKWPHCGGGYGRVGRRKKRRSRR
jgi:hypothetical protein